MDGRKEGRTDAVADTATASAGKMMVASLLRIHSWNLGTP